MIRDRFALAILGLTVGFFTTLAALANLDDVPRNIDIVVLWLAAALQLGLLLTWVFIPHLPRWIVAFWGLILVAVGIGDIISLEYSLRAMKEAELPANDAGLAGGGRLQTRWPRCCGAGGSACCGCYGLARLDRGRISRALLAARWLRLPDTS
jgi:hypothetical protein